MKILKNKWFLITISVLVLQAIGYLVWLNLQEEPTRYIRKNYFSAEAKKDVEALEKALKIMREKDCDDPLSWYYQGAIHWIPDTINNNKLCESYHTYLDKKVAWDNCTHSPSGKEKLHFLVWHRLYIYHFEKIVRKLSGYKQFALPYWGYTNSNKQDKYLHPSFRNPASSLWESARFDSINNGQAISGEIERALDLTKLNSYTSYQMYCKNINNAPHGAIHDYIGHGNDPEGKKFQNVITGTITEDGLMGWVPTAGFDPIFWMHHSNIDRIWQQWTNSKNGQMVTLEELKSIPWDYVFFDENGNKVVYTMEDVIKILYTMDYDFDDTPVSENEKSQLVKGNLSQVIAQSDEKISINSQITDAITIKPLKQLLKSGSNSKAKILLQVSFSKRPKGVYEVYVNLNKNVSPHPSLPSFAGYMTFFGADHEMTAKDCGGGCCKETTKDGRTLITFEYEVNASQSYSFSFYKHNGKHVGDMIVEKIQIMQ
jgi:hypothetical protein